MSASDSLGPQFNFTPAQPRSMEGPYRHSLEAKVGDQTVGHLDWSHKSGEVHWIGVEDTHRRQGIATALWQHAQGIAAETRGVKPPRHSTDRTTLGDAWARSVSNRLPKNQARVGPQQPETCRNCGLDKNPAPGRGGCVQASGC